MKTAAPATTGDSNDPNTLSLRASCDYDSIALRLTNENPFTVRYGAKIPPVNRRTSLQRKRCVAQLRLDVHCCFWCSERLRLLQVGRGSITWKALRGLLRVPVDDFAFALLARTVEMHPGWRRLSTITAAITMDHVGIWDRGSARADSDVCFTTKARALCLHLESHCQCFTIHLQGTYPGLATRAPKGTRAWDATAPRAR